MSESGVSTGQVAVAGCPEVRCLRSILDQARVKALRQEVSEKWKQSGGDIVTQLGLHQDQGFYSEQRGARPDLHKVPGGSQVLGPGLEAGNQGKVETKEAEPITIRCG